MNKPEKSNEFWFRKCSVNNQFRLKHDLFEQHRPKLEEETQLPQSRPVETISLDPFKSLFGVKRSGFIKLYEPQTC